MDYSIDNKFFSFNSNSFCMSALIKIYSFGLVANPVRIYKYNLTSSNTIILLVSPNLRDLYDFSAAAHRANDIQPVSL